VGFRMRKSIRLVPGIRLNVSKRGFGASAGAGGMRYSVHSSGRRTVSAQTGIPGVTYQETVSGRRRPASIQQRLPQQPRRALPPAPRKPGLFAPKGEKQLYKSIRDDDVQGMKRVGDEHAEFRVPAWSVAGMLLMHDEPAVATQLLQAVFDTGRDPSAEPFAIKYLETGTTISIAQGVTAELPINRDAVGLALGELYQSEGNLVAAIDTVEQLEPTTHAAVSLAELYVQAERYSDVVELTDGVKNQDDASALLLCFRGVALREQGHPPAAHEALKEALRSRSRMASIRHLALSERATNYLAQGKKAMARKDLERILAEDSTFEAVGERLAQLAG
jgi:tetratricopeptide (TPR) repeat protein